MDKKTNTIKLLVLIILITGQFVFLFSSKALCQVRVYLDDSGSDLVGQRLVYKIRESIRESVGLELAVIEENSFIQLRILTIDPADDNYSTVYSVVWTIRAGEDSGNLYYTHNVGTCGSNRVDEVAEGIVADTDYLAEELKEIFASLLYDYYDETDEEFASDDLFGILGFELATCTRDIAKDYNLNTISGIVVTNIIYDTPAYDSELEEGDVILEVDDVKVYDVDDVKQILKEKISRNNDSILFYVKSDQSNYKYIALELR